MRSAHLDPHVGSTFLRQHPGLYFLTVGHVTSSLQFRPTVRDCTPTLLPQMTSPIPRHLWPSSLSFDSDSAVDRLVPSSHFLQEALSYSFLSFLPGHRLHSATLGLLGSKSEW